MQPWREKLASYWQNAGRGPVRATVLEALSSFGSERRQPPLRIVDLGCGIGRDTLPLLALGHQVQAIDREETAIQQLCAACPPQDRARLQPIVGLFEDVTWTEVDLAVSSFALPFCRQTRFSGLCQNIGARLAPGGRIACQLLGPNDDFATHAGITIQDHAGIDLLTNGYLVEHCREEESDAFTPRGRLKHWHLFHLVLKKA
jgi:SAM-dependent methyltransferase